MLRFCDMEITYAEKDKLNRDELLNYFYGDYKNDLVCVEHNGRYVGRVTYDMLDQVEDVNDAVTAEQVVLNKDIWVNARNWFAMYRQPGSKPEILPVVDEKGQIVCFAYEDFEANRELRMLKELQANGDAIGFAEIYPQYKCVIINGFNELAYSFAQYLASEGIPVQVNGYLWDGLFSSSSLQYLDYTCMTINAEGGGVNRSANWMNNLLSSVSAEFECIDKIYERNIIEGIIKDSDFTVGNLIEYLNGIKSVIIIGTDIEAQEAADYLMGEGINICCFVEERVGEAGKTLLDKPIMNLAETLEKYSDAVYIDNHANGSAWGMAQTDLYDYMGFGRNQRYFLLKDYVNISGYGLENTLAGRKIALVGDIYLCERLAEYLVQNVCGSLDRIVYVELPDENLKGKLCSNILKVSEVEADRLHLIVVPENAGYKGYVDRLNKIKMYLDERGAVNHTDYYSHIVTFIKIEKKMCNKFHVEKFIPQKIILGSIDSRCGNQFVRDLLDNHPSILMMSYIELNNDLFWFCVRLAGRKSEQIIPIFEGLYCTEQVRRSMPIDLFLAKMKKVLLPGKCYSSQELFVIFHICFMYMAGRDLYNVNNMVIYWEPHQIPRHIEEEYVSWLASKKVSCDIINVVRNVCMNNGSYIKCVMSGVWPVPDRNFFCRKAMEYPHMGIKPYEYCNRLLMRFEDIKCNPREELQKLCDEWEIPWSDTLMETTSQGIKQSVFNQRKYIKDFDLGPVYNLYEEFLSEFDRFRLTLICEPWQKEYGYPYVDILSFSRREVQEMFAKSFRFMDNFQFENMEEKLYFDIRFQADLREILWKVRIYSLMEAEKGK